MVSGSEMTPIVTLIGAFLAIAAISLIPGKSALKKGEVKRYITWGKNAIYLLAIVLLGFAGYVFYVWYKQDERDVFTTGNLALFVVLGIGLVVNNLLITRNLKKADKQKAGPVEEIHEVQEETEGIKPESATQKKGKTQKPAKNAPVSKPQLHLPPPLPPAQVKPKPVKKATLVKPKAAPKPAAIASEELIDPAEKRPAKKKCPSCDTPVDHHAGQCPVCGESLGL